MVPGAQTKKSGSQKGGWGAKNGKVGPQNGGPRRVGAQHFALFFPSPVGTCLLVEFWCLKRRELKCPRLSSRGQPGIQACTFKSPGKQHKKSQHQQQQKMCKHSTKATKAVKTFWKVKRQGCVFHTQEQEQEARMRRGKDRTIKAKRCGAPKGGGGRGVSSRGNSVDTGKCFLNLRSTAAKWRGRGVRRSAAQKQQQAQQQQKQRQQQSRNRNTSNKKSSNMQQNQEQHKQHKQQTQKQ